MNYHHIAAFEWDDAKSDACFTERGFDFAYVTHAFLDPKRQFDIDRRWDYGETRFQLHGRIATRVFVVIYTLRGTSARIISARKANSREVKAYDNRTH